MFNMNDAMQNRDPKFEVEKASYALHAVITDEGDLWSIPLLCDT